MKTTPYPPSGYLKNRYASSAFQKLPNLLPFSQGAPQTNHRGEASLKSRPEVRFFEGKDAIKAIYKDIILTLSVEKGSRKEYLCISCGTDIHTIDPTAQPEFVKKRLKKGIPIRWIAPEKDRKLIWYKTQKQEMRRMKFINDKKYPFHMEISIYGDSVALWSLEDQKPSIVIFENQLMASSMRSFFNFLWDSIK